MKIKTHTFIIFLLLISQPMVVFAEAISAKTAEVLSEPVKKIALSAEDIYSNLDHKIEDQELQIKIKFQDIYKLKGEERDLIGVQIISLEEEIAGDIDNAVSLIQEMQEDKIDVSAQLDSIHVHLNRRNKQLLKSYKFVAKMIQKHYAKTSAVKPDVFFSNEQKMNKSRKVLEGLLLAYQTNIELKKKLGLDNNHDIRVFSDLLSGASDGMSSRLKLVSGQIQRKKLAIAQSGEEGSADFKIELNALNEKQSSLTSILSVVVSLMKSYELDTTKYSQLLITTSGTINQQIFDKEVISGLLVQWSGEFNKWVKLNLSNFVVTVLIIILILIIFRMLSILAGRLMVRAFTTSSIDVSRLLQEFFITSVRRIIMLIGALIALSQTGIELGPLLAGLGVLGFIVGFALQGVLSNFASGLMILIYRPYDVGDVIEIAGVMGTVKEMSMVSTTMLSFSNEKLIIPNNNIWGSLIKNVTSEKERRIDLVFKISFEADIDQVEKIFKEEIKANSLILEEPAVVIRLHKQLETHLEYIVRPWVKTADYWPVYWDLNRSIKKRLDEEGIPRLFPYAFLKPAVENK